MKRMGRRNRPFYRVVAIDSRKRRDGLEIERLGWYDPLRTDIGIQLKEERVMHWLKLGAQPSDTVRTLMNRIGLGLKLSLADQGKSEEEIAKALTEWQVRQDEKFAKIEEKRKAKKEAQQKALADSARENGLKF